MKHLFLAAALSILAACAHKPAELPVVARAPEEAAARPAQKPRKPAVFNEAHILNRLGTPDAKRSEPPAQIWIYRQSACVLMIYVQNAQTSDARVAHMEIVSPTANENDRDATKCLEMANRL